MPRDAFGGVNSGRDLIFLLPQMPQRITTETQKISRSETSIFHKEILTLEYTKLGNDYEKNGEEGSLERDRDPCWFQLALGQGAGGILD
jgi:hypothetical protein